MKNIVLLPDHIIDECKAIVKGYEHRISSGRGADIQRVEAVNAALEAISADIENIEERAMLCQGMIKNCTDGRKCPFQELGITSVSRSDFYRRRRAFLQNIAKNLDIF